MLSPSLTTTINPGATNDWLKLEPKGSLLACNVTHIQSNTLHESAQG